MNSILIDSMRGIRAAIVAGVSWMLAIWLAVQHSIDPALSHSATAQGINRLAAVLGKAGGLVTLLILSVGLGSVSQQVFRAPSLWLANAATYMVRLVEAIILHVIGWRSKMPKLRRFSSWEPVPVDLARRILQHHRQAVLSAAPDGRETEFEQLVYLEVDRLLMRELRHPGNEHGYLRALEDHAMLRFSLVVPIAALVAVTTIQLSLYFGFLAPIPFIIAFQAAEYRTHRDLELERLIWQKIDLRDITDGMQLESLL